MNLPPDFIQTIHDVFKEDGKIFLENLPNLIEDASSRLGLTDIRPVSNLSFNFVAFARRGEVISPNDMINHRSPGRGDSAPTSDVVLKIGVPHDELTSEMLALKLFDGEGACQLLDCDEERGFLLLEQLKPGTMLSELDDDDEQTHIAADVMSKLWQEIQPDQAASSNEKFIQLSDWFDGLRKIRPHFGGGTGPFPKELLERVESFLPELFADENIKLMHGDFHHFNILKSERGWLAIDPKGVIGPAGYEVGPLMINPWNSVSDGSQFRVQAERRVSILSERLGWEREKIIRWATAHAVLSAWWCMEDGNDDTSWEYSMRCARIFSEIK